MVASEDWDSYAADTAVFGTTGTNYKWVTRNNDYRTTITIVPKNTVVSGADATDMCVKIPYTHTSATDGAHWFELDAAEKAIAVGPGNTGYAVVEFDVAISGADNKTRYSFDINNRQEHASAGSASIERFWIDGTTLYPKEVPNKTAELSKNTFYNIKMVIDRANSTYCYLLDGELMVEDKAKYNSTFAEVGSILIQIPKESADKDTTLYLDNVKMYGLTNDPLATN
jgi:hypothetical protein